MQFRTRPPGAGQTPKIDDLRSALKSENVKMLLNNAKLPAKCDTKTLALTCSSSQTSRANCKTAKMQTHAPRICKTMAGGTDYITQECKNIQQTGFHSWVLQSFPPAIVSHLWIVLCCILIVCLALGPACLGDAFVDARPWGTSQRRWRQVREHHQQARSREFSRGASYSAGQIHHPTSVAALWGLIKVFKNY
jgi:hypothetical protein